jgi:hypothetical protein
VAALAPKQWRRTRTTDPGGGLTLRPGKERACQSANWDQLLNLVGDCTRRQRFHSSCAALIAPAKSTTSDGNTSMNSAFWLGPEPPSGYMPLWSRLRKDFSLHAIGCCSFSRKLSPCPPQAAPLPILRDLSGWQRMPLDKVRLAVG